MPYLNLIRWKNLLMLAFVQVLVKYVLFGFFPVAQNMDNLKFLMLVLATLSIAAAGNVINDVQDVRTDKINKPKRVVVGKLVSVDAAYNLFIILNVIGVGLGFGLSNWLRSSNFFTIFPLISMLLYIYATYLKGIALVGNLVVSLLVTLGILIVPLFDFLPIQQTNGTEVIQLFQTLLGYALFAFLATFTREIIKDIQDVDGDHKTGLRTLPILIGRSRAKMVALFFVALQIVFLMVLIRVYLFEATYLLLYSLLLVLGPYIVIALKIYNAEHKKHFAFISHALKLLMLAGMCSMFLIDKIL